MILSLFFKSMVLTQFTLPTSGQVTWQPFGPNMCEELCQRRESCFVHTFDEKQLSCQLLSSASNGNFGFNRSTKQHSNLCDVPNIISIGKAPTTQPEEKFALPNGTVCSKELVGQIYEACVEGNLTEVKKLISNEEVDVNCRGNQGRTAIMVAVIYEKKDIFDYLLEQKCDLFAVDELNSTALHLACRSHSLYYVKKLLNDSKLDINIRGIDGRTPLMYAVIMDRILIVKFLIQRGADVETVDDANNTILHMTCKQSAVRVAKYILSLKKIDLETRGEYGRTALMSAMKKSYVPLVELLMVNGADTETMDNNNYNILHLACMGGYKVMVEYVLTLKIADLECRGNDGKTPLMIAVKIGRVSNIKILVSQGADITTVDDGGNNILHIVCLGGYLKTMKYVLSLNISDIEHSGQFGRTPLMMAVESGQTGAVELLLKQYQASITASDDNGFNVLHISCFEGRLYMVKYLLTLKELRGFERKTDKAGNTPVHLAEMKGHCDIVSFLKTKK